MNKNSYSIYIQSTNLAGSNKAASYVKAIDWLCEMIKNEPLSYRDCTNMWIVSSPQRIHELYEFVLLECRKGNSSQWNIEGIPPSYLQKGYCSAALKSYEEFLIAASYEQKIIDTFERYEGSESELPNKLDLTLSYPAYLLDGLDDRKGEDVVRSVQIRANQSVFRKMVMSIYNGQCCITGLNMPEINRASHIIPWAKDETKRLDPTNGLYLSATYDAAFDKNLISLDDEYRIILSKNIGHYATNKCVKEYFIDIEGVQINLPKRYKPNKNYLAEHRTCGEY